MVQASRTVRVNTDPKEPPLTRGLVWRGLMMKAENPLPFVPVISACRIVERQGENKFVREIVDKGDVITEVVTFFPQRMVKFERTSGRVLGTILNEIIDDGGDLALKFTFTLTVEGIEPGSAAEREFAANMEQGYLMAVVATLKAMRKLARESALPATS
jgi:Domain of unknown function (DUF1857)